MSTTTTHSAKKKALTPKIRFKEFTNPWEKKTLFDISDNVSYGMNAAATEYDGIHKYIRITDIDVDSGEFKPDPLTSPLGEIDEKFKLNKGDIVFARTGASVGKSHLYNPKDGALYYAGFLIKFSITKANAFFIYSLTLKEAYNKWVHIYSMRSGQPGLNAEEYKALKLNIPTLPEQRKIATFLSAIDEKIQLLTRKKELVEQYKKGVMHQLFSGKLRFKDENGKLYPKWGEKRLGDVCDCMDNLRKPLNDSQRQAMQGTIPYWGANKVMDYVNDYLFDETLVLLAEDGGNFNEYETRPIANLSKGKCWVNNHTHVLKGKKNLSNEFLFYSLVHKNITGFVSGGTRAKLNKSEMLKIPIGYPSFEEQQKIANYLSSLDTKIESVTTQITQSQTFKKGLLQQMFV